MRKTGLKFTWEKGSKNDNAIKVFKANNINFEYDRFFNLTADFYGIGIFEKVDFQHIENDDFEICIAQHSIAETLRSGASAQDGNLYADDGKPYE